MKATGPGRIYCDQSCACKVSGLSSLFNQELVSIGSYAMMEAVVVQFGIDYVSILRMITRYGGSSKTQSQHQQPAIHS